MKGVSGGVSVFTGLQ